MALAPRLTRPLFTRGARGSACGAARRPRTSTARATSGRGGLLWRGFHFLTLLGLCGCGLGLLRFRLALGLGLLFLRPVQVAPVFLVRLEVGLVPAAAFEAEHGHGNQLLQGALTARGTACEWRIADLLHDLGVVLASLALVFVERHELSLGSCCQAIITKGRTGTTQPVQAPAGTRSVRAARSSAAPAAALIGPGKGQLSVVHADADAIARDELALQDL